MVKLIILCTFYAILATSYGQGTQQKTQEECATNPNATWVENATSTEATCLDPNPKETTKDSQSYCRCNDGFVLDDGSCIDLSDCPNNVSTEENSTNSSTECTDPNSEYNSCHTSTVITCKNFYLQFSTNECRQGCFCKAGYVVENGTCISTEECPYIAAFTMEYIWYWINRIRNSLTPWY